MIAFKIIGSSYYELMWTLISGIILVFSCWHYFCFLWLRFQ